MRIKSPWVKRCRFLYILLCSIIILLILRWLNLITINLSLFNSDDDNIDLKSVSKQLKENYKNLLITNPINETLQKGILIVSDKRTQLRYSQFSAALNCYAMKHGYIFKELDPSIYSLCRHISDFFFQKHCGVLAYLINNRQIGWLMVLDGDNVLVNTSKTIEDYLPNQPNVYLVHSERFYNGEIFAGNYLIYNCRWSYLYLFNWINMHRILPKVDYHNSDNGALHIHFALSIGKFSSNCLNLWYKSIDENVYDQYVGCIKCLIGGQRRFDHIWLLRRGHAFTRDYREPQNKIFSTDFLIHSFKNNSLHYYRTKIDINVCIKNISQWSLPIRTKMFVYNQTIAQEMIRYHDLQAEERHPHSVGIADVYDCWPFCQSNITDQKEKKYLQSLCKTNNI
jgi:hypothetical protein